MDEDNSRAELGCYLFCVWVTGMGWYDGMEGRGKWEYDIPPDKGTGGVEGWCSFLFTYPILTIMFGVEYWGV